MANVVAQAAAWDDLVAAIMVDVVTIRTPTVAPAAITTGVVTAANVIAVATVADVPAVAMATVVAVVAAMVVSVVQWVLVAQIVAQAAHHAVKVASDSVPQTGAGKLWYHCRF